MKSSPVSRVARRSYFSEYGREVFVAQAGVDGQVGAGAPVVLGVRVDHVGAQIGLLVGRLEAGLLGQPEEHVGERGAGGREAIRSAGAGSGRLRVEAGEDVGSGGVGQADQVEVDAAQVASEAHVVLLVNPGERFGERDGLVDLKCGLLLVEAGELVEGDVGQAVELRIGRGARSRPIWLATSVVLVK